jgi:hypothetical protein
MIKFKAMAKNGRLLLGFGITDKNMELLKMGRPIKIDMGELGLQGLDIIIFHGDNDEAMKIKVENHIGLKLNLIKEKKETEDEKRIKKSHLN